LDKAPDAFRTISEVADDLDIPQHVLRFWETRFTQIKPMKRSGGRRYYRPDDVDLLRGIRRLLYGEGYTIRGVQRILKEHGIKSVQGLTEGAAAGPSFGPVEERARVWPPKTSMTMRPRSISRTMTKTTRAAPTNWSCSRRHGVSSPSCGRRRSEAHSRPPTASRSRHSGTSAASTTGSG